MTERAEGNPHYCTFQALLCFEDGCESFCEATMHAHQFPGVFFPCLWREAAGAVKTSLKKFLNRLSLTCMLC